MMRRLLVLVILCALVGTAGASDTDLIDGPISTNVIFCKLHTVGDSYEFEPFMTLYQGQNEWGRHTFMTGAANLTPGDYALVQINDGKMEILDFVALDFTGTVTPAYTVLTLELREDDLAGPLGYFVPVSSADAGATGSDPTDAADAAATAAPAATTAKSASGLPVVLAGLGIAGIFCAARIRR